MSNPLQIRDLAMELEMCASEGRPLTEDLHRRVGTAVMILIFNHDNIGVEDRADVERLRDAIDAIKETNNERD